MNKCSVSLTIYTNLNYINIENITSSTEPHYFPLPPSNCPYFSGKCAHVIQTTIYKWINILWCVYNISTWWQNVMESNLHIRYTCIYINITLQETHSHHITESIKPLELIMNLISLILITTELHIGWTALPSIMLNLEIYFNKWNEIAICNEILLLSHTYWY